MAWHFLMTLHTSSGVRSGMGSCSESSSSCTANVGLARKNKFSIALDCKHACMMPRVQDEQVIPCSSNRGSMLRTSLCPGPFQTHGNSKFRLNSPYSSSPSPRTWLIDSNRVFSGPEMGVYRESATRNSSGTISTCTAELLGRIKLTHSAHVGALVANHSRGTLKFAGCKH